MPKKIITPEGHAHCSKCKQVLPVDRFYKGSKRGGVAGYCKQCSRVPKDQLKKHSTADAPAGMSWCNHCKKYKPVSDFDRCSARKNGCVAYCKPCKSAYAYVEDIERRHRNMEVSAKWDRENRRHPLTPKYAMPKQPLDAIIAAYVAGIVDAEGSFGLRGKDRVPCLAIYNNDKALLVYVQEFLGGSLRPVTRSNRPGCREWALTLTNKQNVFDAINAIMPSLVLKHRQAEVIVDAMKFDPPGRMTHKDEIARLNAKGVRCDPPTKTVGLQTDLAGVRPTDWAYFSGWIDGDGCVVTNSQAGMYDYPRVHVYSSKPAPLVHLNVIFGGSLDWRERANRWALECSLSFEDQKYVGKILTGLLPYITLKKPQVQCALDSLALPSCERGEFTTSIRAMNQKLRPRKSDAMTARVYSLAEYAQKDGRGAGPKGREYHIVSGVPFTDATVRSLSEVVAAA